LSKSILGAQTVMEKSSWSDHLKLLNY